ncbi:MAG: 2-oxoacid:acceptor oxidoreductase family protein [Bacilli bacterium]
MIEKVICSGFGGQGVLSLGQILSLVNMHNGKHVTWIPAYGAEMRGGTANCSVIYSDELIGSPLINNDISILVAMNQPSVDKFVDRVIKGGLVIVNSSVIKNKIERDDLEVYYVDATDIATEIGSAKFQNMVMLGALTEAKQQFSLENVESAFNEKFTGEKAKFIPSNIAAVNKGIEVVKAQK